MARVVDEGTIQDARVVDEGVRDDVNVDKLDVCESAIGRDFGPFPPLRQMTTSLHDSLPRKSRNR